MYSNVYFYLNILFKTPILAGDSLLFPSHPTDILRPIMIYFSHNILPLSTSRKHQFLCIFFGNQLLWIYMYSYKLTVTKVKQIVKQTLEGEFTGHGYWHSYRVAKLARKIGRIEKANLQVLELAAWLHDIDAIKGRKDHHILGAKQTRQILTKLQVPDDIIKAVESCVLKHRYSQKYPINTIEEKIIRDADNLDALGAVIIPRIFAHCGHNKIPIYDPNIKPNTSQYFKTGHSTTGINHFYEKIFKIDKTLHTKTAKRIAKGRIKFLHTFLGQYLAEFEGKR